MERVKIEIATVETLHPAGTVGGDWNFIVDDSSGANVVNHTAPETAIEVLLDPGSYVARARRLDSAGGVLGDELTKNFTVADTRITVQTAGDLTVEQLGVTTTVAPSSRVQVGSPVARSRVVR